MIYFIILLLFIISVIISILYIIFNNKYIYLTKFEGYEFLLPEEEKIDITEYVDIINNINNCQINVLNINNSIDINNKSIIDKRFIQASLNKNYLNLKKELEILKDTFNNFEVEINNLYNYNEITNSFYIYESFLIYFIENEIITKKI